MSRSPSAVLHASRLVLLLVAAALPVYRPQGRTRYEWRKQQELLGTHRRRAS